MVKDYASKTLSCESVSNAACICCHPLRLLCLSLSARFTCLISGHPAMQAHVCGCISELLTQKSEMPEMQEF